MFRGSGFGSSGFRVRRVRGLGFEASGLEFKAWGLRSWTVSGEL